MTVPRPDDSPLGRVLPDGAGVRLEFVRHYPDPVEDVWAALTSPDRVARWLGEVTGDPASGEVRLRMTAEESADAEPVRIVECEPPVRLVVDATSPYGTWRLVATLRPDGDGTVLVFEHRSVGPEEVGSVGPGWHYYLDRLGAVLAGTPVPDDWDSYVPSLERAYDPPG